jgi:ribosome biogenesis GTPase
MPEAERIKGVIVRSTGSHYEVQIEDAERIPCRIRGKFRLEGWKLTNPVAVGDKVVIEKRAQDPIGQIVTIEKRRNYVARQSPRQKHGLHLMAANIDQAVLVTTFVQPTLKPGFIDRFLLMTQGHEIPVLIFINKCDLLTEDEEKQVRGLQNIYESIGYQTIAGSAESNAGISKLKSYLNGKITLFAGQSGVGKSTLLNALEPGLGLRTADISERSGKGLHTTTNAEMFPWGPEGAVIDSPGIKNLSFNHFTAQDVAHNFREFFVLSKDCKFADCTHRNEPKCAVKKALEDGQVSALRYQHYLQILEEVEAQNAWDRPNL